MSDLEERELEQSLFAQFEEAQETFDEAQSRKESEEIKFNRVKNFIMDKVGTYRLRILPLSPKDSRRGYEHPVRQMWLKINNPANNKNINIKVCKATDAGLSVDLIDEYKKAALSVFANDKDMQDRLKSGSFGGGLKYDYNHAMYVIDLAHEDEGMMVWESTNGQFKALDEQKEIVWRKLIAKEKDPRYPCPISSYNKGYPIEINKKKTNGKVEYVFTVDTFSDIMPLDEAKLKSLIDAPLLSSVVKKYTKYHLEATIEFLRQYDESIGENVLEMESVQNAIEIIKGELPADDTSTFSLNEKGDKDAEVADELTYESLSARYDELTDQGKTDKTEEGVKLREDIQTYIKTHNLSVMVKRTKTNMMLLDEIQEELEELGGEPEATEPQQPTRIPKQAPETSEPEEDEEDEDEHPNQDSTAEPAVGRRRRR